MLTYPAPNPLNGEGLRAEIEQALGLPAFSITVRLLDTNIQVNGGDSNPTVVQQTVANHKGALDVATVNAQTIRQRVDQGIQTMTTWINNNPNGVQLTAAQTLQLVKMVNGLAKLVRDAFTDTAGT